MDHGKQARFSCLSESYVIIDNAMLHKRTLADAAGLGVANGGSSDYSCNQDDVWSKQN
jgi:hypothetical protein